MLAGANYKNLEKKEKQDRICPLLLKLLLDYDADADADADAKIHDN